MVLLVSSLQGTTPHGQRHVPVQLVSGWATDQRWCLAHTPVAAKRHEVTTSPQVLDLMDTTGRAVSLDAIGYQRAVATTLIERGAADYVLVIQQNQGDLHAQIVAHFNSLPIPASRCFPSSLGWASRPVPRPKRCMCAGTRRGIKNQQHWHLNVIFAEDA